MECVKSFSITVDPAGACAVNQGTVTYVNGVFFPATVAFQGMVASNDLAHVAVSIGLNFPDYYLAFFDTTTDTQIAAPNVGTSQHIPFPVYATVNQTFWFPFNDGVDVAQMNYYDIGGVLVNGVSITADHNLNSIISYEPNTALIYTFPGTSVGTNDRLFIINPATEAVTNQTLEVHGSSVSGGHVLACPGFIFVTGLNSMSGQTLYNIYTVPAFALAATINLDANGWAGGFAYAANTGKVYFGDASSALIYEINPNNGVTDFTYNLVGQTDTITSLVYDPVLGRLIAFDGLGAVATLDPVARTIVCVETTTSGVTFYSGAAGDGNLGKAYGNPFGSTCTTEIWQ